MSSASLLSSTIATPREIIYPSDHTSRQVRWWDKLKTSNSISLGCFTCVILIFKVNFLREIGTVTI